VRVSTGPHTTHGGGRSLAEPAFAGDDGRPDEVVRAVLGQSELSDLHVARYLRGVRLLTSIVAVLDEVDHDGSDKDSHMAVVSMVNERGERGLLAFTGTDSLAAWSADARPMPSWGRDVALAALEDGATAVVIDVQGPSRRVLTGTSLSVLADQLDLPVVAAAVQRALAGLGSDGQRVDVRVEDDRPQGLVDVLVTVTARPTGHPDLHQDGCTAAAVARQAAEILAGRPDLRELVPGGIGIAMAPVTD
jgi:hypothetical protein